jgi:5-methyltetrahydrofolate--homocysteine methyltransferase
MTAAADIREKTIDRRLADGELLIADGAMGTLLMARGLAPGSPPEVWNVEQPQRIAEVHRAYLAAGSQIILTNTFGGSRIRLAQAGKAAQAEAYNRAAAELARAEAGGDAYVAGDIGPCGGMLEPLGDLTYAEAVESFAGQARSLAAGGVDLLWVETMMDPREARAAVEGARRETDRPLFCSLSFGPGARTMMGATAVQALAMLREFDLAAFGANCGEGLDVMDAVVDQLQSQPPGPALIAKPNAGLPRMTEAGAAYDVAPAEFARRIAALAARGAQVVGGCCGSTPEFIAAIAREVAKV